MNVDVQPPPSTAAKPTPGPTRFRIRSLSQSGPGVTAESPASRGTGAFMALSDQAGAVYDVSARENSFTEAEVVTLLRQGRLNSGDLVLVDGAWTTLLDSVPFGDEAAGRARSESLGRNTLYVIMAFSGLAVTGALIALRVFAQMLR